MKLGFLDGFSPVRSSLQLDDFHPVDIYNLRPFDNANSLPKTKENLGREFNTFDISSHSFIDLFSGLHGVGGIQIGVVIAEITFPFTLRQYAEFNTTGVPENEVRGFLTIRQHHMRLYDLKTEFLVRIEEKDSEIYYERTAMEENK